MMMRARAANIGIFIVDPRIWASLMVGYEGRNVDVLSDEMHAVDVQVYYMG